MKSQECPPYSGKVCGIAFPYQGKRPLPDESKAQVSQLIYVAIEKGKQEEYDAFLVPLCDAYNISIAQHLAQLKTNLPQMRIIALVPALETELPTLAVRIAAETAEALADEVRRIEQPVEDFPLMVALHCDVLMICSCNNVRDTKARNTLLADIEYAQPTCEVVVIE